MHLITHAFLLLSRATAFIGNIVEWFPIVGGISLPIVYLVTHQDVARRVQASFDFSFALALSETLSQSQQNSDLISFPTSAIHLLF